MKQKEGDGHAAMEIALFLVLAFIAYLHFSAEKERSVLHKTFSVLLVVIPIHLILDGTTVYPVNHLDTVPELLSEIIQLLSENPTGIKINLAFPGKQSILISYMPELSST